MHKKKAISIWLWICIPLWGLGQGTAPIAPEYVYAHLDHDMYISGEHIWYTAYFLQPVSSLKSTIVHVDLFDSEGLLVAHKQHPIEGNQAHGEIYLDPAWEEGVYTFRCYTLWNQNFEASFSFERQIPVYDVGKGVVEVEEESTGSEDVAQPSDLEIPFPVLPLSLKTHKNRYKPRDSVHIAISLPKGNGDGQGASLSVSVVNKQEADYVLTSQSIVAHKAKLLAQSNTLSSPKQLYPAQNSLVAWGEVAPEPNPTSDLIFYLTDSSIVRFAKPQEGSFWVSFPDFIGEQVLQVFAEEGPIIWGSPQDLFPFTPSIPKALPYTREIREVLLRNKKRKQFEQLFDLPSIAQAPVLAEPAKPLIPDQVFFANEYIAFSALDEFIRETVYIRLKGKAPAYKLRLLDRDRNLYFKEAPLFLVNGYITQDQEAVLRIPWRDVERVELFLSSYRLLSQFATLGNQGVMAIYTRSGKTPRSIQEEAQTLPIKGFSVPLEFTPPQHGVFQELSVPDVRATEFWSPRIILDKDGKGEISFFHSDGKGEFLIKVEGVTSEGTPVSGQYSYTVE